MKIWETMKTALIWEDCFHDGTDAGEIAINESMSSTVPPPAPDLVEWPSAGGGIIEV
jgi:hypothetical protein